MENVHQVAKRVEKIVAKRLPRLKALVVGTVHDPRKRQGVRHDFGDDALALLVGLLSLRTSLRRVETLSAELGLGRDGTGISDGALGHMLKLCDEHVFDELLVRSNKDAIRRGQFKPSGLNQHWVAIDGKYSTLDHHCGGLGQKVVEDDRVYWKVGYLRASLVSAAGRPALAQWAMGPRETTETNQEKLKHTGEITNLMPLIASLRSQYGDLVSNVTLDAGLWSKEVYLDLDAQGIGVFAGLKSNRPDLHNEVVRVLNIERRRSQPLAETPWQAHKGGVLRRRLWRSQALDGWNGWTNLRQVVVVEQTWSETDEAGNPAGKTETELRYFVTNATTGMLHPEHLLLLVRRHWAIENDCNWTFDVQFGEDDRAWSTQNKSILVLGVLRMIAYNMLQHMRKSHIQVISATGKASPRPWADLGERIRDALRDLYKQLGPLAVAWSRIGTRDAGNDWAKRHLSTS